jgi:hypothetical protein
LEKFERRESSKPTRRSLVQRHNLAKIALDSYGSVRGNSGLVNENTQSGLQMIA